MSAVLILAMALVTEVLILAMVLVSATGPLWAEPPLSVASVAYLHIFSTQHHLTQTYQMISLLLSTTLLPSKEFIPSVKSLQKRRSSPSKTLNWKPSLAASSSQISAQFIKEVFKPPLAFLF